MCGEAAPQQRTGSVLGGLGINCFIDKRTFAEQPMVIGAGRLSALDVQ